MSAWRPLSLFTLLLLTLATLPASAGPPFEMHLAGQLAHGVPHDAVISGNYAYVAAQGAVVVLDISIAGHPIQVCVVDTPGSAEGLAVSGNYLYVADWDKGLRVIDITDPLTAHEDGSLNTGGYAYGVAVSGSYAYVADHEAGLKIVDLATMEMEGEYDTAGYAWSVAVFGNYAFVADGFNGLVVLNVTNKGAPSFVTSCAAADRVMDVAISGDGNFAYLADGTAGLRVVDISDPATPDCNYGQLDLDGRSLGVSLSGDPGDRQEAYVAAEEAGLHVVDIRDPSSPVLKQSYDTPGRAYAVAAQDTAAYVADDSGGLRVVDISGEPAPTIVGQGDTAGKAEATAVHAPSVLPDKLVAHVADGDGGTAAFDVTRASAPAQLSGWSCPGFKATDIAVQGDYVYAADWDFGLRVLHEETPTAVACGYGERETTGNPNGIAVQGDYAYLAAGEAGLAIIDVSNPASPGVPDTIGTPGSANDVDVDGSGQYAYVADGASGLQILDVSQPTPAGIVRSLVTGGYAYGVDYANGYAYVACGDGGLQIFDVATPAGAALAGQLESDDLGGSAHAVFVSGDYAFVSVSGRGVAVVEVRDPADPQFVSACDTPSAPGPADLTILGGYAYVADAESGLVIVDVLTPYVQLAALESPAYGERLAVARQADGSAVGYIAAGAAGLQVVQVSDAEDATDPALVRWDRGLGEVSDIAVADAYGYAAHKTAADTTGRLSVLKLNGTNPYSVGSVQTPGPAVGAAAGAIGAGSYALVAGGDEGLSVISTVNKSSPTEKATLDTPGWCSDAIFATLAGDPFACLADGDSGLRLVNLSPVATPPTEIFSEGFEEESALVPWTKVGSVTWYTGAQRRGNGSARLRGTAYMERTISTVGFERLKVMFYLGASFAGGGEYVRVLWSSDGGATWEEPLWQITDGDDQEDGYLHSFQSSLLPERAENNPIFMIRVELVADELSDYGLVDDVVITSETSSQPQDVGVLNTPGQARGVAVSGDYALVADAASGLRIVDVSAPGIPEEVSYVNTDGHAEAVATYSTIAAVADGENGLVLLDFRVPTAPVEIAYYDDAPGWASDVQVLDGHAYVADAGWGLIILQLWYSFRDILYGHWAFSEIEDITDLANPLGNRITIGYDEDPYDRYHPEIECSRDQMSVFIARAMNWVSWDEDMRINEILFLDVPAYYWAGSAIKACMGSNPDGLVVVMGYTDAYFRPLLTVKRDDMCVFIARAKEWIGATEAMYPLSDAQWDWCTADPSHWFPDVSRDYWCAEAIYACRGNNPDPDAGDHNGLVVVKGYPDGYFRPWKPVTRDQMAVFIWRAFLQELE